MRRPASLQLGASAWIQRGWSADYGVAFEDRWKWLARMRSGDAHAAPKLERPGSLALLRVKRPVATGSGQPYFAAQPENKIVLIPAGLDEDGRTYVGSFGHFEDQILVGNRCPRRD